MYSFKMMLIRVLFVPGELLHLLFKGSRDQMNNMFTVKGKVKVKLCLSLTKYRTMKIYPVLN